MVGGPLLSFRAGEWVGEAARAGRLEAKGPQMRQEVGGPGARPHSWPHTKAGTGTTSLPGPARVSPRVSRGLQSPRQGFPGPGCRSPGQASISAGVMGQGEKTGVRPSASSQLLRKTIGGPANPTLLAAAAALWVPGCGAHTFSSPSPRLRPPPPARALPLLASYSHLLHTWPQTT